MAKKGFGDLMLAKLREVPHASTDELATAAQVTPQQAYSRLTFLEKNGGGIKSVGKGTAKIWHVDGTEPPPEPTKDEESGEDAPRDALGYELKRGWKPSHRGLIPLDPVAAPAAVGDKLLVEYPEHWRNSVAITVRRLPDGGHLPDTAANRGVALCDLIGNSGACYVDVKHFQERGWKVSRLTKKDITRLFGE